MAANLNFLMPTHRPASSSFFFRLLEDLGTALEPTQTQLQTLERSYLSTGQYLSSCEEFAGNLVEIHPHGSRELGTITRPLRNRDGFDIDLIARFQQKAWATYSGRSGATLLLNQLTNAVSRYAEQHGLKLHRWERCVTLEYADGMCADIAPVIDRPHFGALHGELHGLIPDRHLDRFQPTNPRGFTKYFNSVAAIAPIFVATEAFKSIRNDSKRADVVPLAEPAEVFGRLLCRLVQIMKLHRDVAFGGTAELEKLAPSSIFLTVLAGESYKLEAAIPHADPVDLFLSIIQAMPATINRSATGGGREEWTVDNPTAPGDNLASAMNTPEKQQAFTQWHSKLEGDISAIIGAIDGRQGIDKVGEIITSAFGERASNSARRGQVERQATARHIGKVSAVTTAGIIVPVSARSNTFFGD